MSDKPLSPEDRALFRRMTQDVTPLKGSKPAATSTINPPSKPKPQPAAEPPPTIEFYLSSNYSQEVGPDTILSYRNPKMPKKRFKDLQQGFIPWTAKLDLHGHNADTAAEALLQFLNQANLSGQRCLLIIHGKGQLKTEAPKLKNLVNHWLKQIPSVLAFHSARPKHGGTGAVYVFLLKLQP